MNTLNELLEKEQEVQQMLETLKHIVMILVQVGMMIIVIVVLVMAQVQIMILVLALDGLYL